MIIRHTLLLLPLLLLLLPLLILFLLSLLLSFPLGSAGDCSAGLLSTGGPRPSARAGGAGGFARADICTFAPRGGPQENSPRPKFLSGARTKNFPGVLARPAPGNPGSRQKKLAGENVSPGRPGARECKWRPARNPPTTPATDIGRSPPVARNPGELPRRNPR